MYQIENVLHGLQVFRSHGYETIIAADGVVYAGGFLEDEAEDFVSNLGWQYDEDRGDWYFLVEREAAEGVCKHGVILANQACSVCQPDLFESACR